MNAKRNARSGRRRPARRIVVQEFGGLWTERVECRVCGETFWHVEVSTESGRDGYVPPCPNCGGPCLVVLDLPEAS